MQNVAKRCFETTYTLECGQTIPVRIGYETYGQLSNDRKNAILVCHFFSANSHAAGKYHPDDAEPGWWDMLIGPGKAIDTDRYFVICTDTLCNIQLKNPHVITTGPGTINPETGDCYGMAFPQFTYRDMAGIQFKIITEMGIEKLVAVIGPSAGGMQALNWAVHFPDNVEAVVSVISGGASPILTSLAYLQSAIDAIKLDPNWREGSYYGESEPEQGLALALQLMNLGAYQYGWYDANYKRVAADIAPYQSLNNPPTFLTQFKEAIAQRMNTYDANHYLYTARAAMLHNIANGFSSMEEALSRITARVLMIPCKTDLLFPPQYSWEVVDIINKAGGHAACYEIDSPLGHMAGVLAAHLFADQVAAFIEGF
ncbi:alpha/beta fold hydrolase [Aneurinibacillus sp. Ricciae_BoGa-3]|uniref:alpha/beta fold hydrolase n=1 Tax=Aneurinibacillus sp. Ricciae_BoGa-3 TaxID=3022697 RepID=UPI003FA4D2A9